MDLNEVSADLLKEVADAKERFLIQVISDSGMDQDEFFKRFEVIEEPMGVEHTVEFGFATSYRMRCVINYRIQLKEGMSLYG